MNEQEYREQVLNHLSQTIEILEANNAMNLELCAEQKHGSSLSDFLRLINSLVLSMEHVNSNQAFAGVVKGLEMVLEKEFFQQIGFDSQSRQSQPKQPKKAESKKEEPKAAKPTSIESRIKAHLAVDPSDLPEAVTSLIATELKQMGLPAEEVDAFFGLN